MKRQRLIEKDDLIVTHFGGLHTFADAFDALDELPVLMEGKKYIYEIIINDEDMELNFTRAEEALLNEKVKSTFEKFKFGALAVVAYHDLVFGLSKVLEINIKNERIAVSVFRTEDPARQWIQEIRTIHESGSIVAVQE